MLNVYLDEQNHDQVLVADNCLPIMVFQLLAQKVERKSNYLHMIFRIPCAGKMKGGIEYKHPTTQGAQKRPLFNYFDLRYL